MQQRNNINESKTEFLFESDAEKVAIKEAQEFRKPKVYKLILVNSIVICTIMISCFYFLSYYEKNELANIKATIIQEPSYKNLENEKLNNSSNNLKTFNNYYNKYGILINKANPITENIVSNYKQVIVENNIFNNIKLEEETYKQYLKLKDNLLKRGYYINIKSGFRSFNDSEAIYKEYEISKGSNYAEKYVAKPGVSEHNTGLAFDFVISKDEQSLKTNYDSDEYYYLENIAYLYGFIIRYPKDKEFITGYSYEPWHLRYVGKDLAKYLKKNNLTLEEYYEINKE